MRSRPSSIRLFLAVTLFCVVAVVDASAQQAAPDPTPTPPIPLDATLQQLMTPEEFRAAGLKKLSAAELDNLNKYLRGVRAQGEKAALEKVAPPPSPRRGSDQALIESKIVGTFTGLKGRSRWLLTNGQVWQQGNSDEHFSVRVDNPDVALVRTPFGYKMVVNGVGKAFYVKQVVLP